MTKQVRPRLKQHEYDFIMSHRNANNVGIIGDTHEPFCLPGYREFCYETFNRFSVNRIVHAGDETDGHAISYHESDPDGMSAGHEQEAALKSMHEWYKTFPNVDVIIGNHTRLYFRKAKTAGIPSKMIKSYKEVWEAPNGWNWNEQIIINDVLFEHGEGCGGQQAALKRAIDNRMSTIIGHIHTAGGVYYSASDRDLLFGMSVGCGVDNRSYAMHYGRHFGKKPVIGCGLLLDGRIPVFVPMPLGKKIIYTLSNAA